MVLAEYRGARSNPFLDRDSRTVELLAMVRNALRISAEDSGFTRIAAGPARSLIGAIFEVISGHPRDIASMIGKPNPSSLLMNAMASAPLI